MAGEAEAGSIVRRRQKPRTTLRGHVRRSHNIVCASVTSAKRRGVSTALSRRCAATQLEEEEQTVGGGVRHGDDRVAWPGGATAVWWEVTFPVGSSTPARGASSLHTSPRAARLVARRFFFAMRVRRIAPALLRGNCHVSCAMLAARMCSRHVAAMA